jgi:hypothetical protein
MAKGKTHRSEANFWGMVRDVSLAAISKGQLPVLIAGIIFIIMALRMPPDDISKLAFQMLSDLRGGYLVGYLLSCVFLISWYVHARSQRRTIADEVDRIGKEKSKLQSEQIGPIVESSKS